MYSDLSEVKLTDLALKTHKHIYKNPVGQGFVGGKQYRVKESGKINVEKGDLVVKNPSPIKWGLEVGSGDLIGFEPVIITQDMVGKTFGRFKSVEIKTKNDKISRQQIIWYFILRLNGCIAIVLHCNHRMTLEEIMAFPRRSETRDKDGKIAKILDREINKHFEEFKRRCGKS
jgi:ribosomal protein L21